MPNIIKRFTRSRSNSLEHTGGNYTEAAKLLGLHPNYLHRLIRNLGLKMELKKAGKL
jgi:transcriptional regulator with GAF, ATPase, and Fis domain